MRSRHVVIALWGIFLTKGLFYAHVLPLWEGYDEFAHYAFVEHLATNNVLPDPHSKVSAEISESLSLAPLPWTLRSWQAPHVTHDRYWQLSPEERQTRNERMRSLVSGVSSRAGREDLYEGKQPPLYYWILSLLFRLRPRISLVSSIFELRIVSILIASTIVPLTYAASLRLFARADYAVQVAALVTAFPELFINIARVGNESLAIPIYGLFVYLCILAADESSTLPWAATVLGFGLLTKAYFISAVPVLGILVAITGLRHGWSKRTVGAILFALMAPTAIAGWWYLRNVQTPDAGLWVDTALPHGWTIVQILHAVALTSIGFRRRGRFFIVTCGLETGVFCN